ncbi:MAG: 16S rRNA processing protein RimM [Bacteroidetes bacterium]|nr:16S rRNA processing protein RimM [Bacteroidota bacterium]
MAYISNILLGRITKVNGYKGAVTVKLEKIFSENIPQMESVFLEIEGRPVPFFISYSEYSGAAILKLKFEGYDSVEKISEFTGCRVFLTTAFSGDKHTKNVESLVGFRVLIRGSELLGLVSEVIPNPGQWLLNIVSEKDKDILIPFHEHFILSIDKKKKIIVMDIPEGLTEIN